MSGARKINRMTVEEYLAGELDSQIKHEYLDGVIYSMVGARNSHNIIGANALVALSNGLRGHRCRPFNSDTKIRLRLPNEIRFYYPDVSVVCNPNPQSDSFQDKPVVILEVLSRSTRRTDEGEKKDAYLAIPSLAAYLLIEQESAAVTVWRKIDKRFVRENYQGMEAVVPLSEIDAVLTLADIYETVEFTVEQD